MLDTTSQQIPPYFGTASRILRLAESTSSLPAHLPVRGQSLYTTKQLENLDNSSTYRSHQSVLVWVGPESKPFSVSRAELEKMEHFAMLLRYPCRETVDGHLELPDIDPECFSKLLQTRSTHDFFPTLIKEYFCEDFDKGEGCASLEIVLEVVEGTRHRTYEHKDQRIGHWFPTDATHRHFDQIVRLYCLAERWLMEDLKELCLIKIKMFPLGGRALAVLAEFVVSEVPEGDTSNWNQQLWELFYRCVQFHQYPYESRRQRLGEEGSALRKEYKPLSQLLKRETDLGRSINRILDDARDIRQHEIMDSIQHWTCEDERMAVCTLSYTAEDAKGDYAAWPWGNHGNSNWPIAPAVLKDDNLYQGFQFCHVDAGDILAKIVLDMPVKGFIYCENKSKLSWGFLPLKQICYLQQRSIKDCTCDKHREWTFSYNGVQHSMRDIAPSSRRGENGGLGGREGRGGRGGRGGHGGRPRRGRR
ncbi:MAG: hypothetical protein M1812_006007 [Candelaria pacifica]|nr:MAG: hypothetical protein M1812_006007 [Candelaria pacifica]